MIRNFAFLIVALFTNPLLFADSSLEYQVKAVCVLNAARFVTWPASAFAAADSPLVIGVLGENPFGSLLEDAVNGQTVQRRRIVVRQVNAGQAAGCHILFVCRSERDRLATVFQKLGTASVLTMSEIEGFAQSGGMLALTLDRGKIRFECNPAVAQRAGLKIDSQFLLLSRIVK